MKIFEYQTIVSGTGYNFKEYVDFLYNQYYNGPQYKQFICDYFSGDRASNRLIPVHSDLKLVILFGSVSGFYYTPDWSYILFIGRKFDGSTYTGTTIGVCGYDIVPATLAPNLYRGYTPLGANTIVIFSQHAYIDLPSNGFRIIYPPLNDFAFHYYIAFW